MVKKTGVKNGTVHPITSLNSELVEIFGDIGYSVALGPEMETEYYNFDALNVEKGHSSREMWDTFWIKDKKETLLRTHTSSVQIRYMEKNCPPLKIISIGKVFRNEATDATHEIQFHQLEGLCISENTTLADLKGTLEYVLDRIFPEGCEFRYRPSYFPFTEPSLEVDIKRKGTDNWIEVLGCGMVHPLVLTNVGIDPRKYKGFAFGIGVDRILSIRNEVHDIRELYKGDARVINEFHI